MNSKCFLSIRRKNTTGLTFPININGIHDEDIFKDHEKIKNSIENIATLDELKEFVFYALGKGDGKFLDFSLGTINSFDDLDKLIIKYSFEIDENVEKGDIEYNFEDKTYNLKVTLEPIEVEEDEEDEGVFGEMGIDDWPDSWFNVEFENPVIDKYLAIYKVEMKDPKYKTNAIGYNQKCPFYGATNRKNLTRTIISYLVTYSKDNLNFRQHIVQDEAIIRHGFTKIKGSYARYNVDETDCSEGADFELINDEIVYDERICYGGW